MSRSNKEVVRLTDPLPNTTDMWDWCESVKAHILKDPTRCAEIRTFKRKKYIQIWANLPKGYNEHGKNPFKKVVV